MINAQQIEGHWDSIRGKLKERWGQLTDDDLKIVGGNVNQLIGAIEKKTGEGRERIERFIDEMVEDQDSTFNRARETAQHAREAARDYAYQAGDRMREGYAHLAGPMREGYAGLERHVKEHPAQSTFAMFGLGMITGLVLGLMVRSE
jgi:uncharacterized protein YjbJ (UPF0337 family)